MYALIDEFNSWNRVEEVVFNEPLLAKVQENLALINTTALALGSIVILASHLSRREYDTAYHLCAPATNTNHETGRGNGCIYTPAFYSRRGAAGGARGVVSRRVCVGDVYPVIQVYAADFVVQLYCHRSRHRHYDGRRVAGLDRFCLRRSSFYQKRTAPLK